MHIAEELTCPHDLDRQVRVKPVLRKSQVTSSDINKVNPLVYLEGAVEEVENSLVVCHQSTHAGN